MKKIIIAVVLAVVLIAGGLGSFAYAQGTHEPMTGQKLVGWGGAGLAPGNRAWIATTNFSLINPDCVSGITIERVCVFKADGTLIYEGPPLVELQGTEWTLPLEPHQSIDMLLTSFVVEEGTVDPLDFPDFASYTIEVFWTGPKGGLPLTGWSWMLTLNIDAEGNAGIPSTSAMSQMVNMEQASTKAK